MPKDDHRPPAFLLYVNDFCSDGLVEAMTTEEVGAYFLLLCKAWMEDPAGTVPDDDRVLSRWARLSAARWSKCKANVMAAFKMRDGRWHQSRMQKEYAAWQESARRKSDHGSRAAHARWGHAHAMPVHSRGSSRGMPKNAISISSSISPSSSASFDDDDDGAKCLSSEDEARVRACANRIAKVVNCRRKDNRLLAAKVALLWHDGFFSDDDIEQVLESFSRTDEAIRNTAGWFHTCLANRCIATGRNFEQMLVTTTVPAGLLVQQEVAR